MVIRPCSQIMGGKWLRFRENHISRTTAGRSTLSFRNFNGFGGVIGYVGQFLDTVSHRLIIVASTGASMFANRESAPPRRCRRCRRTRSARAPRRSTSSRASELNPKARQSPSWRSWTTSRSGIDRSLVPRTRSEATGYFSYQSSSQIESMRCWPSSICPHEIKTV